MLLKKKQVLTATLIIALAAALTVNWYYSKPQTSNPNTAEDTKQESVTGTLGDTMLVAGTNVSENSENEENNPANENGENSAEYFASARMKQTNESDKISNEIDKILNSDAINEEGKKQIQKLAKDYSDNIKAQTDCENLIKAKVGGDCLLIINGETAQVVIENGKLNDNVILQITEIIEKNSNISAENLTIIEAK